MDQSPIPRGRGLRSDRLRPWANQRKTGGPADPSARRVSDELDHHADHWRHRRLARQHPDGHQRADGNHRQHHRRHRRVDAGRLAGGRARDRGRPDHDLRHRRPRRRGSHLHPEGARRLQVARDPNAGARIDRGPSLPWRSAAAATRYSAVCSDPDGGPRKVNVLESLDAEANAGRRGGAPIAATVRQHRRGDVRALARPAAQLALYAAGYWLAYRFGMRFSQAAASPFWFPDSVLLCALVRTRPRHWWIFLATALPIRLFSEV